MTVDDFRILALSLPMAIEKPHFDRASFRVDAPRGKTIATMLEAAATANVFLSVEEQEMIIAAEPSIFPKFRISGAIKAPQRSRLNRRMKPPLFQR